MFIFSYSISYPAILTPVRLNIPGLGRGNVKGPKGILNFPWSPYIPSGKTFS
jgi:hypothetical protein